MQEAAEIGHNLKKTPGERLMQIMGDDNPFMIGQLAGETPHMLLHRDNEVREICALINMIYALPGNRILVLHGPRGSGISSLLEVIYNTQKQLASDPDTVHHIDVSDPNQAKVGTKLAEQIRAIYQKRTNDKSPIPVVILDNMDAGIVPPTPGVNSCSTTQADDILYASGNGAIFIIGIYNESISLLRRHRLAANFQYREIKVLSEAQQADIINEHIETQIKNQKTLEVVKASVSKMISRSHMLKDSSLKTLKRISMAPYVRIPRDNSDLKKPRIKKDSEVIADAGRGIYTAMAVFSKYTEAEIQRVMEFNFSKEEIVSQIDSKLMLNAKNHRFITNTIIKKFIGAHQKNRPVANILSVGPTGSGKTETARVVADIAYGDPSRIVIIDCSEFGQPGSMTKLIGSGPGYVGYGEDTHFIRSIKEKYPCVILFDEIEKAHEDFMFMLLQILDTATVHDGSGIGYDLSKSIIFITSNLGSERVTNAERKLGFKDEEQRKDELDSSMSVGDMKRHLTKLGMRPEFLNRIDGIMVYPILSNEQLEKIARMNLIPMISSCLPDYSITVTDDEKIYKYLVDTCDPKDGGRSILRNIKNVIIPSIIDLILKSGVSKQIEFKFEDMNENYRHE